jgi:hypothetical protein
MPSRETSSIYTVIKSIEKCTDLPCPFCSFVNNEALKIGQQGYFPPETEVLRARQKSKGISYGVVSHLYYYLYHTCRRYAQVVLRGRCILLNFMVFHLFVFWIFFRGIS